MPARREKRVVCRRHEGAGLLGGFYCDFLIVSLSAVLRIFWFGFLWAVVVTMENNAIAGGVNVKFFCFCFRTVDRIYYHFSKYFL